jgi:hypothetical protein
LEERLPAVVLEPPNEYFGIVDPGKSLPIVSCR